MTDNGVGYRSKLHAATVAKLGIRHLRTRPYRPRTNGKAERFIQTLQAEWAYAVGTTTTGNADVPSYPGSTTSGVFGA